MQHIETAIANGFAAYQRGDLQGARRFLESVQHPQAWHVLGLVERKAGRFPEALKWLERAEKADPQNPEIPNNKGRTALDAGESILAETCFRRALQLRPNWLPALNGLGRSLNAQERWKDAAGVWAALRQLSPNDAVARYNAAMAALETGQVEHAASEFDALIRSGLTDPAVFFMRGRARLELSDLGQGLDDFRQSWQAQKAGHTLRNLANTLWMMGDEAGFRDAVQTAPNELIGLKIYLMAKSGDADAALAIWERAPQAFRDDPEALTAKANIHKDRGEGADALMASSRAHALRPNQANIDDALVNAQLMTGDPQSALQTLAPWRKKLPNEQSWIAQEMTALRLAGAEGYGSLLQADRFIQAFELPIPPGFDTIEAFNAALIEAIAPYQSFSKRPLDQTLRDGTQTARDLVNVHDPVIQAYIKALDTPIRAYMQSIGSEPGHPFLGRNTGNYEFNGCWSVTLTGGGKHVNHVHPRGWISSAYYAKVPPETARGDSKAGWIKFGEPPFATEPKLGPEKWIQPKAGMLALFPSYMWHGTEPILDGSERVTVPFDVVPV